MVGKARRHISENSHLDDSRLTIHQWPNLHEYLKYTDDALDSGWGRHPHELIHGSWLGKSGVHCSDEQPVNQACTHQTPTFSLLSSLLSCLPLPSPKSPHRGWDSRVYHQQSTALGSQLPPHCDHQPGHQFRLSCLWISSGNSTASMLILWQEQKASLA